MSLKKITKRSPKQQENNVSFNKSIKDFHDTPAKLVLHAHKEMKLLRQKEARLKNDIKKAEKQLKADEKKVYTLTHAKTTTKSKNQKLKIAKRGVSETVKIHNGLLKNLKALSKEIETLDKKQSKLVGMRKHLAEFEKSWGKKPKNAKKVKATASKKTVKKEAPASFANTSEKSGFEENISSNVSDDIHTEDTSEFTS